MDLIPRQLVGLDISERLRIVELIEERPFTYFFRGDVLALSRVVGSCSVTVYRPSPRVSPQDLVEELRAASHQLSGPHVFAAQQIDFIRHGEFSGFVYVTGEPVLTTLSQEVAHSRFMGYEEGERVIVGVARALRGYHEENRTHGRVRPYHILKTADGWKLTGHEMLEIEDRLLRALRPPDEAVYLPPENYRKGLYGPAVDLWALGVCTHLASCGRLPYAEEGDLIEQLLKNPPRVEKPPGRFGSVVRALLSSEPEERWGVQRCIDHIERPRDSGFTPTNGHEMRAAPDAVAAESRDREFVAAPASSLAPLYRRPGFFAFALLAFVAGTALGWKTAQLPPIPKHNDPPEMLYSVSYQRAGIDRDGRMVSRTPEQTVAYAEELGRGNRLEMVQIPPGAFYMGSPANEPYSEPAERPVHHVQISGFFLSRFEITQQQWAAVAASPKVSIDLRIDVANFRGDDRPVEGVTWLEAKEFCARLSRLTGRLYRLPTEAEWEYACRAGGDTPFSFGQTVVSSLANYQATKPYASEGVGEYRRATVAVGSLDAANAFGLSDMHGNVAEWCEDVYGYYSAEDQTDPMGPITGRDRVVRGGGWRSYPWQCRSASRIGLDETFHRNDVGFRVVLPAFILVPNPNN